MATKLPSDEDAIALAVFSDSRPVVDEIIDRLKRVVVTQAAGFTTRRGKLAGQRVLVVMASSDESSLSRVTSAVISAHHPRLVAVVGFATALTHQLKKGHLLVANRITGQEGKSLSIDMRGIGSESTHLGTLLTRSDVPKASSARLQLAQSHGALAVDRIAWPIAETCRAEQVALMAVHVVNAELEDDTPAEVNHLLKQQSLAGKAGALLGGVVRRPSTVKDLWRRKQSVWEDSQRLVDFLTRIASR